MIKADTIREMVEQMLDAVDLDGEIMIISIEKDIDGKYHMTRTRGWNVGQHLRPTKLMEKLTRKVDKMIYKLIEENN